MISATRRWLRRNTTNFAVGLGVLGAGYVATQYVWSKLTEAGERRSSDRVARENLRRRFAQNQEDCTFTVLALLPTAAENILEAMPLENITLELQRKKTERLARSTGALEVASSAGAGASTTGTSEPSSGPPSVVALPAEEDKRSLRSEQSEGYVHTSQVSAEGADSEPGRGSSSSAPPSQKTKAQLWMELKIGSLVRTFTLLYTLALLTLLTRIQLNLLGRRNYVSSVYSLAPPQTGLQSSSTISLEDREGNPSLLNNAAAGDFDINRRYLTFTWWLLHRGWRTVMERVEQVVRDVFGPLNPREEVSFERLAELVLEVRRGVEGRTGIERRTKRWLPYLLPPPEQESVVLRESGMAVSPPDDDDNDAGSGFSFSPAAATVVDAARKGPLRQLLNETADLIDSPHFNRVLTHLLDAAFSLLIDAKIREQAFSPPPPVADSSSVAASSTVDDPPPPYTAHSPLPLPPSSSLSSSPSAAAAAAAHSIPPSSTQEALDVSAPSPLPHSTPLSAPPPPAPAPPTSTSTSTTHQPQQQPPKTRLANILALMTRQAHSVVAGSSSAGGNEYLRAMDRCDELDSFAAVVFCENFLGEERWSMEEGAERRAMGEGEGEGDHRGGLMTSPEGGGGRGRGRGRQGEQDEFERVWGESAEVGEEGS